MNDMILLSVAKKKERLIFIRSGKTELLYKGPVGGIMLQLMQTDSALPAQISNQICSLLAQVNVYKGVPNEAQELLSRIIDGYNKLILNIPSELLSDFFSFFPLAPFVNYSAQRHIHLDFTNEQLKEIQAVFSNGGIITDPQLFDRLDAIKAASSESIMCNMWISLLSGKIPLSEFTENESKRLIEFARQHLFYLFIMSYELYRLTSDLPDYIHSNAKVKNDHWLSASLQQVMQTVDSQKKYPRYECYTLSGLIALEFKAMHECGNHIVHCSLCNDFFVAKSKNTRYCSKANPAYGGKLCSYIGPQLDYKSKIDSDPVLKHYEAAKKTYKRWVKISCKDVDDNFDPELDDKTATLIKQDIQTNHKAWKKKTKIDLKNYLEHKLSSAEAYALLSAPDIWLRSIPYDEWREFRKDNLDKYSRK